MTIRIIIDEFKSLIRATVNLKPYLIFTFSLKCIHMYTIFKKA